MPYYRPLIWFITLATVLATLGSSGCRSRSSAGPAEVVATTTMLADLVLQLAGDDLSSEGIMAPGGDPHPYQPTPSDARMIAGSRLVVTSGLHLEGWIDDLVENAGGDRPIVVASASIEPLRIDEGGIDPHFWFDIQRWSAAAAVVSEALIELAGGDSEQAQRITERTASYRERLDQLDAWVRAQIATIPESQRVLVTSHDAFAYFGETYGVRVEAIQGVSTEQEASQRDVATVVELVRQANVPAVFVETSVNRSLIEQVARETGVEIAGPLYSDSIGPSEGPAGSYIGMVTENVRMIVEGLGGSYAAFSPDLATYESP